MSSGGFHHDLKRRRVDHDPLAVEDSKREWLGADHWCHVVSLCLLCLLFLDPPTECQLQTGVKQQDSAGKKQQLHPALSSSRWCAAFKDSGVVMLTDKKASQSCQIRHPFSQWSVVYIGSINPRPLVDLFIVGPPFENGSDRDFWINWTIVLARNDVPHVLPYQKGSFLVLLAPPCSPPCMDTSKFGFLKLGSSEMDRSLLKMSRWIWCFLGVSLLDDLGWVYPHFKKSTESIIRGCDARARLAKGVAQLRLGGFATKKQLFSIRGNS